LIRRIIFAHYRAEAVRGALMLLPTGRAIQPTSPAIAQPPVAADERRR
jgi:hypothetical protein